MIEWPILGFTERFFIALGVRATITISKSSAGSLLTIGRNNWKVRDATSDEVVAIRKKCGGFTASDHKPRPLEESLEIQSRCPAVFRVILSYNPKTRKMSSPKGYAFVYPFKKRFTERLLSGNTLLNEATLNDLYIGKSGRPSSYYVAFLWGDSTKSQAALLAYLFSALNPPEDENSVVFARPTTRESLAFIRRNKFRVVAADENQNPNFTDLCYRQLPMTRPRTRRFQSKK